MRAIAAMLAVMSGCASSATAPTRIVIVPDASMQSFVSTAKDAAALWSTVGAEVQIADSGNDIALRLIPATEWTHGAQFIGTEGVTTDCPMGECIDLQREVFLSLETGEQEVLLAHEFGHALGLGHVADQFAVMYHAIHPLAAEGLRPADAAEYFSVHP